MVGVNTVTTNRNNISKTIPVSTPQSPLSNYETYIIIAIDYNGKIDFLYEWKKTTKEAAIRCGDLLYHINEGHFANEIMRHLLSFEEKNFKKEFIRAILLAWKDKIQSVKPAVRPLAFFRHGKMVDHQ